MKILLNGKIIAKNPCDCRYLMSAIGLRFRKSFNPYDCFIIYMAPDSVLDSVFVNFEFIAAWVDSEGRVLGVKNCKKSKFFPPVWKQSRVYEFPIDSKFKIKRGDKIIVKK
jgi:hypothetical protein